ncbi:hypothetical protein D9Q98_005592 [Chlorella vulgaris]|uniref:Endopeptidase S2P n=1 Tax=Chlorella vulgaris TaxID=3077 RepID=A0A9D4YW41_CHLVU|nr:hypothetical protein D9Q98_005592 [Chlorella vulgaris]
MLPLPVLLGAVSVWTCIRLLFAAAQFALSASSNGCQHCEIELTWWRATVRVHTVGPLAPTADARSWLRSWFCLGAIVGLLAAACSVLLLVSELLTLLRGVQPAADGVVIAAPRLQLAIPGLTLPWSHAAPLWLALAISLAVHEAGHAAAAVAEGAHISAAGFSLILLLPAAFVELDTQDLGRLSMLRVATAGAWHNAVLAAACWGISAVLAHLGWWLPAPLRLLLAYAVSLSAALCLLNMAPVHFLDGQQALGALLLRPPKPKQLPELQEQSTGPHQASHRQAALVRWILHAGSGLYLAVLALHLLRMY